MLLDFIDSVVILKKDIIEFNELLNYFIGCK